MFHSSAVRTRRERREMSARAEHPERARADDRACAEPRKSARSVAHFAANGALPAKHPSPARARDTARRGVTPAIPRTGIDLAERKIRSHDCRRGPRNDRSATKAKHSRAAEKQSESKRATRRKRQGRGSRRCRSLGDADADAATRDPSSRGSGASDRRRRAEDASPEQPTRRSGTRGVPPGV